MKTKFQKLSLNQLDEKLTHFKPLLSCPPPKGGWLKAVRSALGMTTTQLAERIEIKQPSLIELEQSEVSGSVSLKTLRRAAEAMDCALVYALVPRSSLEAVLDQKAQTVAEKLLSSVNQTMALEKQSLNSKKIKQQLEDLKTELKLKPSKTLWR